MGEKDCYAYITVDLKSQELYKILDLLSKPGSKNTTNQSIILVNQNRILHCPSPLSPNFSRNIFESNPQLSAFNGDIQENFNAQRKIVLIKQGRKTVFLNKPEEIVMVESKVKRKLFSKEIELRRIDSASLIKLLRNVEPGSTNISRSKQHNYGELDTSHVTNVEGRAVKAEKSIQEPLTVWSAPGGNESYENPSHPSTDKYPTQVTDTDVDCLSMEVTPSARYRFTAQESSVPSVSYSFSPTSASSRSNTFTTSYSSSEAIAASSPSPHSSHQSESGLPLNCSPKYVQYMTLASRLNTFRSSNWLVNEKPDINTFANQGMFFTGREDLVRCFVCGIGLKDWIKTDDVMEEHRKYSSACPYLLQKLTSTEVDSSRQAGNQMSYRVRSPQYQTMNARLETFERFPSNVDIPHQQLAVAGLFYTGEGDLCRCFTCDGGLKDWSTGDDPCKEHATYFPKCNYIIQLKGAAFVRDMQHRRGSNVPSTGTGGGSAMQTSTATTATTAATTTTTGATNLSMPSMDRLNIS
ncbi:uncharacterized protein LOC132729905, partial [Ruditapes philippinarum]|uniref:uncharacterized protein LOC132729905 n=1 Tax=Ruditapes philippinarum TaxID=129788 RepID=UPI00295ABA3F